MKQMLIKKELRLILSDSSLWLLLFSNIVTIVLYSINNWDKYIVLWVYWFQCLIIFKYSFFRMLRIKNFYSDDQEIQPSQLPKIAKIIILFFFLFIVGGGIFQSFFFVLFKSFGEINFTKFLYIVILSFSFYLNYKLFFKDNNNKEITVKDNILTLMVFPYLKVAPIFLIMLITIFDSNISKISFIYFLIIKTAIDCLIQIVDHRIFKKEEILQHGKTI